MKNATLNVMIIKRGNRKMMKKIEPKNVREKKKVTDIPAEKQEKYNYCLRCGRKLKTEDSIKLGYGAVCYKIIQRKEIGRLFNIYTIKPNGK